MEVPRPDINKENVTTVPAGQVGTLGWKRWISNAITFSLSVFSLYLGFISGKLDDGFQWQDLLLNAFMMGVIAKYVIDTLQDLINKYRNEKKYVDGNKVE